MPKLTCNLFSVQGAVAKGNAVEFGPNDCCIWDENGKGPLADKLLISTRLLSCYHWVRLSSVISLHRRPKLTFRESEELIIYLFI